MCIFLLKCAAYNDGMLYTHKYIYIYMYGCKFMYEYIWDTPISVALKECAYFLLKSAANNDGMLYMHKYIYIYMYIYVWI
jgi:hypothetical protein